MGLDSVVRGNDRSGGRHVGPSTIKPSEEQVLVYISVGVIILILIILLLVGVLR